MTAAESGNEIFSSAFYAALLLTGMVVAFSHFSQKSTESFSGSGAFKRFQITYLAVYYLMMAGDWLQGPYVYALYASYGYSKSDIAILFVTGFGASMVFGTFMGTLADRLGRKLFCLLYVGIYILSCVTKHFNSFWCLMVGRICGGIATSLLYSVFDAWLVFEHEHRSFPRAWLSRIFSLAFFGNSLVAIFSGVVSQYAADLVPLTETSPDSLLYYGGYTAPFDLAILVLAVGGCINLLFWNENYGSKEEDGDGGGGSTFSVRNVCLCQDMRSAVRTTLLNRKVFLCGAIQSLFEGSMYTFVFMWTPVLTPPGTAPPYGQIFATFMVSCMAGSSLYAILINHFRPEQLLVYILTASAIGLAAVLATTKTAFILMGFNIFEICVGLYFPAMATLKSKIVPEESRAAIYTIFRVPLNAIVLTVLLSDLPPTVCFGCCVLMLALGVGATLVLLRELKHHGDSSRDDLSSCQDEGEGGVELLLGGLPRSDVEAGEEIISFTDEKLVDSRPTRTAPHRKRAGLG